MSKFYKLLLPLVGLLLLLAGCGPAFQLEVDSAPGVPAQSFDQVEAAIRSLDHSLESFLLLEPAAPLEDSVYLQAYLPYLGDNDGLGYYLELCVRDPLGYRYYQTRTTDVEAVVRVFSRYYKGRLPNLAAWDDVTWEDGWEDGWDDDFWDDDLWDQDGDWDAWDLWPFDPSPSPGGDPGASLTLEGGRTP